MVQLRLDSNLISRFEIWYFCYFYPYSLRTYETAKLHVILVSPVELNTKTCRGKSLHMQNTQTKSFLLGRRLLLSEIMVLGLEWSTLYGRDPSRYCALIG